MSQAWISDGHYIVKDEKHVKLPYQEVQTTEIGSVKNGGPGLGKRKGSVERQEDVALEEREVAKDNGPVGMNAADDTTIDVDLLPEEKTKFAKTSTIIIDMLHDDSPEFEKNYEIEGVLLDAVEAMVEVV
ncbi:hypothetical protein L7F22_024963 [Adiantum nelumboides]|nr:hypothetical protein [Adiantum nelumboides]